MSKEAQWCILVVVIAGVAFLVVTDAAFRSWLYPEKVLPMAKPYQFSLSIETDRQEYSTNENVEIYCHVANLTGMPLRFDGYLLLSTNAETGEPKAVWRNSISGRLYLESLGKVIKRLDEHANITPAGHRNWYNILPPEGQKYHIRLDLSFLGVGPGTYNLHITVLGKSARATFIIKNSPLDKNTN